jgi:hypothetical protein
MLRCIPDVNLVFMCMLENPDQDINIKEGVSSGLSEPKESITVPRA